jgi:glycosyltransferase involved in cell wall biosynthesis
MRIAFYAPMKPPGAPVPSGDRTMARLLIAALTLAGHEVDITSNFRSWDGGGNPDRQRRLALLGGRLARRVSRRRRTQRTRPQLWLTYHVYHKAPDYLGPHVSAALGIPYVIAEASSAGKQANGRWAPGWASAAAAIAGADLILGLNPADDAGVLRLLPDTRRLRRLLPFVDARPFAAAALDRAQKRRILADRYRLNPGEPWLLSVAMMRPGDKLASFRLLAQALAGVKHRPWRWLIVGDGPAAEAVKAAVASLGPDVTFLGRLEPSLLPPIYAASDLYVWPAIGEAWGMSLLEAQAAALPVVAGQVGGVAAVVADGETGLLVTPGDVSAFAGAVKALLDAPRRRALMSKWASRHIARRHDLPAAARSLSAALASLSATSGTCA